jgi:hypothetical protein
MKSNQYLLSIFPNKYEGKWLHQLYDILKADDCEDAYPKNPQRLAVSYVKGTAMIRIKTTKSANKQTFGLEELVSDLNDYDQDLILDCYGLKGGGFIGHCYVFDNKLIGCEFVEKTMHTSTKVPPNWNGSELK